VVKNNIFVASGGNTLTTYAFYFNGTAAHFNTYKTNYDIDYNNYYSTGTNIGYVAAADQPDLSAWKTVMEPLDSHSVNILPFFNNPAVDLNLSSFPDNLLCPRWQNIHTDIRNINRPHPTAMGAYTQFTNGQDLMLKEFSAWSDEVVYNQIAQVNVVLFNIGNIPITTATFGWSVNNTVQTPVTWTATPVLNSLEERTINIGSFQATNIQDYNIVVWIQNINGMADTINKNDTISVLASLKPLAEFVAPFVADTVTTLSFPVNTLIRSWTGATINVPKMTLISTIHGTTTIYDTIAMTQNGNIWQAVIPPQHYDTKIVYSVSVSDTIGNSITLIDSTYIRSTLSILGDSVLISSLSLIEPLNAIGCLPDYTPIKIALTNKGTIDYDFIKDTILFELEIVDADTVKHRRTIPFTGILEPGVNIIELMSSFPTIHPGAYNIKIWISSPTDNTPYKDTLYYTYISGKVGLPIDENFSANIPLVFDIWGNNTTATWMVIPEGTGTDTAVQHVFGTGMLSFNGSLGATSTFATRQMDLSRTLQPALSFWYFHDTIPCEDYTDVRITIDGGTTYNTLLSLTKYDAVYGWRQYSMDLPSYAVNQCVILIFEAMEKSRSGDVSQYIDRIRIIAKQDIAVTEVLASEYSVCDLENKELKVVLSNLTDPVLNYTDTLTIILEVQETGQVFTKTLTSGSLAGFSSDTITLATGFDLAKGTYSYKTYFSSVLDVDRQNDTLVTSLVINPAMDIQINQASGGTSNCLTGEQDVFQSVVITNTGNMDLFNIGLILQIDTGETGSPAYTVIEEICTDTILVGNSLTYTFKHAYKAPWKTDYYPRVYASLTCDSTLINTTIATIECVDVKDLYLIKIDNPSSSVDRTGSSVQVQATLGNRDDLNYYTGLNITVVVTNSQGVQMDKFTELTGRIGMSSTATHNFTQSYTVPNDTVYYLIVYIDSYDNYRQNDTSIVKRTTDYTNINAIESNVFTLGQNIPNPANNSTRIDYSVPEAGEVIFHVHSISGQLLYSQTIETKRGTNSIELNTSTFAAGVYFYSMEYKGQRLVKQLIINSTN
jgi:hypothetical protein